MIQNFKKKKSKIRKEKLIGKVEKEPDERSAKQGIVANMGFEIRKKMYCFFKRKLWYQKFQFILKICDIELCISKKITN